MVGLYDTLNLCNTVKVQGVKPSHKESSVKAVCRAASGAFERQKSVRR